MTENQARAVRFDRYGERDVLYLADLPSPGPDRTKSWSRSRPRASTRARPAFAEAFCTTCSQPPFRPGRAATWPASCSAVGAGATDFAVGDEVLGYSWTRSTHATHAVVPQAQLIPKPAGLSWEVAGGMYVVACTAWAAVEAVDPQPGETVVVSAAAGGVGTVVTQLLGVRGAQVLGIASPASAEWLRAHGATPVAYGPELLEDVRAAAPDGVDAFIDLFGPEYLQLATDLGVPPAADRDDHRLCRGPADRRARGRQRRRLVARGARPR